MDNLLHYYQNKLNQPRLLSGADAYLDNLIIEFVDALLRIAVQLSASDIHIESILTHCRIRFRLDGLLQEALTLPASLTMRIVMRLKIMANLDIGEKRLPQDGRLNHNDTHDIRISTCPSLYGEKVVLRLLQANHRQLALHELGLSHQQLALFTKKLSQPQGLILVTGPTGSGKTATLYSALQFLNSAERNIVSIEDPIEITLSGITQINVNARIGLDFANILRSVLRQDPDIIMVGEIRDKETATMAIQAAQTGHLVLSTMHANHVKDVLPRLKTLGIPLENLSSGLSLLIAQRLVRKKCPHCQAMTACNQCRQGYQGRTGIFSLATFSADFQLTQYESLHDHAQAKLTANMTTVSEIARVLGQEAS